MNAHHRFLSYVIVAIAALSAGLLMKSPSCQVVESRVSWPASQPHPRTIGAGLNR